MIRIISVRENPEYKERVIDYIQSKWPSVPGIVYEDSIEHSLTTTSPLPQWYLLQKDDELIGCAGLITNDFISRMDLYPWVCALFIDEKHRGNAYGSLLLEKAKQDSAKARFENLYLCTGHTGYYEKFGFTYIGQGYHPWDEESRIYSISLKGVLDKPDFTIRPEREDEEEEIYNLIRTAFKTANVKDGDEQDFASGLRKSANYIPELALVARTEEKLIGHIMFTKTYVTHPDGTTFEALLVAPVSVFLEYRNKGVGGALIRRGFEFARAMGYKAAFLVGDPAYYQRFGFVKTSTYGIRPKNEIPEQYVMVKELEPNALDGITGTVQCC